MAGGHEQFAKVGDARFSREQSRTGLRLGVDELDLIRCVLLHANSVANLIKRKTAWEGQEARSWYLTDC